MPAGEQTTTGSTQNRPWGPAKDLYRTAFDDAMRAYTQGRGGDVYTGSTVVPYSDQTTQGMNGMMGLANANAGGNGLSGRMQDIINNGGFNQGQMNALGGLQGLANNSNMQGLANGSGLNGLQEGQVGKALTAQQQSPFNDLLRNGGMTREQAGAFGNLQGSTNLANQFLSQNAMRGGLTEAQARALGSMQNSVNTNNQAFQNVIGNGGLSGDQRTAMEQYRDLASSNFDINSNPAFQQVLNSALQKSKEGVNANAAAAGRFGSGVHQGVMQREQGDLASRMIGDEYRNWQNRSDAARNSLMQGGQAGIGNMANLNSAQQAGLQNVSGLSQQGLSNQQNSLNQMNTNNNNLMQAGQLGVNNQANASNVLQGLRGEVFGMGQQGVGNQNMAFNNLANANNSLFNANQAGLSNMSAAYQAAQDPYKTMMGVGSQYEDLYKRQMDDQLRIFDAQNQQPWQQIQRLLAAAQGAGAYGNKSTTSTSPGPNPLLAGLGTITQGAGLLGGLFGAGSSGAGFGGGL